MRRSIVLLLIAVTALAGCKRTVSRDAVNSGAVAYNQSSSVVPSSSPSDARTAIGGPVRLQSPTATRNVQEASLNSAGSAQGSAQAAERKIIRNAEITIETDAPNDGQRKIAAIAEKHGGFVVTSESRQNDARSQTVAATVVNVIVRVPAQKFAEAIEEIRGVGGRILHEKISGQDVTEEYIDLEARIRTKRALEAQFLEIMKQARKVSTRWKFRPNLLMSAPRLNGWKAGGAFWKTNRLSTINITLSTPAPVVAATTRGFFYDLKAAFGDGVDTGTEIILGIIRFVIVMIPVTLFILLPAWLVFRWLRRRIVWPGRTAAAPRPIRVNEFCDLFWCEKPRVVFLSAAH